MGGVCGTQGKIGGANKVFVWKTEWYRKLGRPRRRWEGNIKIDVQEVGWEDMDSIALAQNREKWWALVNAAVNLRVS